MTMKVYAYRFGIQGGCEDFCVATEAQKKKLEEFGYQLYESDEEALVSWYLYYFDITDDRECPEIEAWEQGRQETDKLLRIVDEYEQRRRGEEWDKENSAKSKLPNGWKREVWEKNEEG